MCRSSFWINWKNTIVKINPEMKFNPYFEKKLKKAKLSKKNLADLLLISPKTVYQWQDEPPGYALAYLDLVIKSALSCEIMGIIDRLIKLSAPKGV